jgi:hypothetical protein
MQGSAVTVPIRDYTIDDLPTLSASLGKAGCDRIRFHTNTSTTIGSVRERAVMNPHRLMLQEIPVGFSGPIDDILSGVANLGTDKDKPLSVKRLHVMLQSTNRISTGLLEACLNMDSRQARRYMAASRLAIYHINRHLTQTNEVTDAGTA